MKNIKYLSLFKLFKDNIVQESMISLDNSFELSALYRKLGWRLVRTIFTSKVKTQSRMRTMYNFFQYLLSMRRKHGSEYVVKYLKLTQLAIQKCIAGEKISSLRELDPSISFPRVSNSGLPMIIPLSDRRAIKNKSTTIIRFWLTLFSLYRIVNVPGSLKLETITAPYSGSVSSLGRVSESLEALATKLSYRFPKEMARRDMGLSLIETSSPSSIVSWTNLFHAPLQLARAGLGQVCLDYMQEMGYSTLLRYWVIVFKHAKIVHQLPHKFLKEGFGVENSVGQLSTKKEAAGKIRVFAMVDVWTQSLLKPLHLSLFSFLKSLPNDGTFDQTASWKRCAEKAKVSGCSFGYDLSAATDRLPIELQVSILKAWIGPTAANLWKQLLTGRDYILKTNNDFKEVSISKLRYAVGQPMGALSSWAMLAVTHHLLVQLAYLQSDLVKPLSWKWYTNYEILGDDVIIFDKEVAHAYLTIMESIGVPINLSKSVVASNPTTEFAKVTTHFGDNVSALSWKMFISQNTMMGRVSMLWSLIHKAYLPPSHLGTWLTDVCAKSRYNVGNSNYIYFPLLAMFAQAKKISYEHLLRSLYNVKCLGDSNTKKSLIQGVNSEYLRNLVVSLIQGKELRLMSLPDTWNRELAIFKGVMVKSIKAPNCDPPRLSRELAQKIVLELFPKLNNIMIWDTKLKVQFSEMLSMQTDFNFIMREILFEKLTSVDIDVPMNYLRLSVEEILDLKEKADRAKELLSILDRANDKLNKKPQILIKKTSSIQVIQDVLRMRKFVVTWPHMKYESETTNS